MIPTLLYLVSPPAEAAEPSSAPVTLRGHRLPTQCVASALTLDGALVGGRSQTLAIDGDGIVGGTARLSEIDTTRAGTWAKEAKAHVIELAVSENAGSGRLDLPPLLSAENYEIELTLHCVPPKAVWDTFQVEVGRELLAGIRSSVAMEPNATGCAPHDLGDDAVARASAKVLVGWAGQPVLDALLVTGLVDVRPIAEACVPLALVAAEIRDTDASGPPSLQAVKKDGKAVAEADLRSCADPAASLAPPQDVAAWRAAYGAWCERTKRLATLTAEEAKLWERVRTVVGEAQAALEDERAFWVTPRLLAPTPISVADATEPKGTYFAPQFGVGVGAAFGGSSPTLALTPYVGLAIYPQPIDRAVPLSRVTDLGRRLGGVLGVTLYTPRWDPLGAQVEGLLGELAFVAGFSWRLTRYLDFVGIAAPYRVPTNDPLDDRFTLGSTVSFGFAFDADVWSFVKKPTL